MLFSTKLYIYNSVALLNEKMCFTCGKAGLMDDIFRRLQVDISFHNKPHSLDYSILALATTIPYCYYSITISKQIVTLLLKLKRRRLLQMLDYMLFSYIPFISSLNMRLL